MVGRMGRTSPAYQLRSRARDKAGRAHLLSFKVGNTPHKAAMRSMELMIGEVKPRADRH
jgi:hypothetical protein